MHKVLVILALFSVGCAHAVADGKSDAPRLYPLTKLAPKMGRGCTFQLKGAKSPEINHLVQIGYCYSHDEKGTPVDVKKCTAVSVININNKQRVLRQISYGGPESARYKDDDYVVEMKFTERDCDNKKVSCTPFYLDGVLTVKKGSMQETFEVQGNCPDGEDESE